MAYNYIPKYIRQSENKSPKSVVTASRWNELFNLLIKQGDHTAEELGKILDYLSTGLEDLTSEKLDKTGGVINGDLGVTGKLNIGATVAVSETNVNLLQLAGDYDAPVIIRNVATPAADNDAATKKYVDERAGESVLYVNITQSGSAITGDKTYDEILAAVTAGKCVIAKLAGLSFCLDSVANDKITFQRLDIVEDDGEGRRSIQKTLIYVYNDGVWTGDVEFVAVDTAMSDTSRMPVQNKVVKAYIDGLVETKVPTKTSQLTNDSGFLTSHQDISGKQDKSTLEADVAAKGFTKNTGTYSKPAGGIPKADLAAAVQTSLGKADTALQEHQSLAAYRTAMAQNIIDAGKQDKLIAGENITIASDGKTISATGGRAETLFVTITDNNGALSADKSYSDIFNAIIAGIPVLVSYGGMILPLIGIADALYFGLFQCANADVSNGAMVATVIIEITENNEVNDISAQIDIPSAVTDDHINSLIDTKLGVIENGSY